MLGFQIIDTACDTILVVLEGVEMIHGIRKGQATNARNLLPSPANQVGLLAA